MRTRTSRHLHIRKRVIGTTDIPRLAVFRSSQHIYAQIIDDTKHQTLIASSDLKIEGKNKSESAFAVGQELALKASKKGIKKIVFDRGGFLYHGRVEQLAKGAREGGLDF